MTAQAIDWASLLLDYRKTRGLKQAAAAEDFGVSQATVSRWESGASEPAIATRNRLLRFARRRQLPLQTTRWAQTFRRIPSLGLVVARGNVVEVATTTLAMLFGVPGEALEGLRTQEILDGDAPEINARREEAAFFGGQVVSYEAAACTELNRRIGNAIVYVHYLAWPHFGEDGEIRCVEQGVAVPRAEYLQIRRQLGGVIKASFAI
jgi:transcriptional regulator with XRE-family HTH domain